MTNENEAPKRIWVAADLTAWCHDPIGIRETDIEYTRADLSDAKDKRIAKLTEALQSIVIEHDSPIWGEDYEYRVAFERSVAIAEAALEQTKGETE